MISAPVMTGRSSRQAGNCRSCLPDNVASSQWVTHYHAAERDLGWRLGRVYFLAFLNPSQGQPDPALTARLASPRHRSRAKDGARLIYRSCRRQGLPVLPCRACRTGTVAPGGGVDRESRRRSERKPRQGRPDAAGARGAGSGMAGCRPGACGPRAIRAGRRTPARDHPAGPGSDRRPDAPERRGGAGRRGPGSPGYRRVQLSGASRPVVPSR